MELDVIRSDRKAIVDDELFPELAKYKWELLREKYIITYDVEKRCRSPYYLTRFILKLGGKEPEGRYRVNHKNDDSFDHRLENLLVTEFPNTIPNIYPKNGFWYVHLKHTKRGRTEKYPTEQEALKRYRQLCLQYPKAYMQKFAPKSTDCETLNLMLERISELQAIFSDDTTSEAEKDLQELLQNINVSLLNSIDFIGDLQYLIEKGDDNLV